MTIQNQPKFLRMLLAGLVLVLLGAGVRSAQATSTVDSVTLTKVIFVLEEIDFEPLGDDVEDDDDTEIEGPIILSIPLDGSPLLLDTSSIEPGTYEEIELELRPLDPNDPDLINLSDMDPASLVGRTIYIEGFINGDPNETFIFEDTQILEVENNEIFEVIEGNVTSLILQIPTDQFFVVGGEVLDPRDPTCFAPIRLNIRNLLAGAEDDARCAGDLNGVKLEGEILAEDRDTTTGDLLAIEVLGLTIVRTGATELEDEENNPVDDSVFTAGTRVEVRGILQNDGTIVAEEIELDEDDENEVEFEAPIEDLVLSGPDVVGVVVLGVTVEIDANTEIEDEDGDPIAPEALNVGDFVEIEAQQNGALVALSIEVEDDDEDDLKVKGFVESKGADLWIVSGVAVIIDGGTEFEDDPNTIDVGDRVEVQLAPDGNGGFVADEIELDDEIEVDKIEGVVASIETVNDELVSFVIAGVLIVVDENSRFIPPVNVPPFPDTLQEGQRWRVEGLYDAVADEMLALRIKPRDRPCGPPFDDDDDDDNGNDDNGDDDSDDEDNDDDDNDDNEDEDEIELDSAKSATSDSGKLGLTGGTGLISFGVTGSGAINDASNAARDWNQYR